MTHTNFSGYTNLGQWDDEAGDGLTVVVDLDNPVAMFAATIGPEALDEIAYGVLTNMREAFASGEADPSKVNEGSTFCWTLLLDPVSA